MNVVRAGMLGWMSWTYCTYPDLVSSPPVQYKKTLTAPFLNISGFWRPLVFITHFHAFTMITSYIIYTLIYLYIFTRELCFKVCGRFNIFNIFKMLGVSKVFFWTISSALTRQWSLAGTPVFVSVFFLSSHVKVVHFKRKVAGDGIRSLDLPIWGWGLRPQDHGVLPNCYFDQTWLRLF